MSGFDLRQAQALQHGQVIRDSRSIFALKHSSLRPQFLPSQLFGVEGKPALVAAFVRSLTSARASSNTTTAVFSLNETVTFETPETFSIVFLTMYGQASQYMLSTAKVTVRCSAIAAPEERMSNPSTSEVVNFVIDLSIMSSARVKG